MIKKLMKYEIKGTYKFILGLLVIIILASSVIQFNILSEINSMQYNQSSLLAFMMLLSVFVLFGAFIILLFYIINSFRRELYEDRGYLTFTLPITGNQIVASKMLVALMWSTLVGFITIAYNVILNFILFKNTYMAEILKELLANINLSFIVSIFTSLVSSIGSLLIIYFAISLSKVSIKNKKIGGLWFILFLVISGITNYISSLVALGIPYYLDLNSLKVIHSNNISGLFNSGMMEFGMGLGEANAVFPGYLNLASFLVQILFLVLFFIGTGYLLEEKIEL